MKTSLLIAGSLALVPMTYAQDYLVHNYYYKYIVLFCYLLVVY